LAEVRRDPERGPQSWEGGATLWDVRTASIRAVLNGHTDVIEGVAFSAHVTDLYYARLPKGLVQKAKAKLKAIELAK
jgi:hypothetical protein